MQLCSLISYCMYSWYRMAQHFAIAVKIGWQKFALIQVVKEALLEKNYTSTYVQHMSLAGRCSVRGNCGCKHDTVDLWLIAILQDLVLASYSCVIASYSHLGQWKYLILSVCHYGLFHRPNDTNQK